MLNRFKQFFNYIFIKYDDKNNNEIKRILSDEEYNIFNQMSNYDKVHSFNLYKKVKENKKLKSKNIYLKLALLHDCGKNNASLFKRIKKVILGDAEIDMHPLIAYEKLKDINFELAFLCKIHHIESNDEDLKIFMKLDENS